MKCKACKDFEATIPDTLVLRAAELGLLICEYDSVEKLEKGIIAAEALRENEPHEPDDFTGATPGDR